MIPALRAANPVAAAPPVLDPLALATFIDHGWYDAHLRAARRRFRSRRDLLVRTLGAQVPECRVAGTAAGLHILLHLPTAPTPAERSGPRPPPVCAWRTSTTTATARSGRRSARSSSDTETSATPKSPRRRAPPRNPHGGGYAPGLMRRYADTPGG
jgi:DNA-binding transcriptional MocR family regulator